MKNYRPEVVTARSCGVCAKYRILFGQTDNRYGGQKTVVKGFYCGSDPTLHPTISEVMTCDDWESREKHPVYKQMTLEDLFNMKGE